MSDAVPSVQIRVLTAEDIPLLADISEHGYQSGSELSQFYMRGHELERGMTANFGKDHLDQFTVEAGATPVGYVQANRLNSTTANVGFFIGHEFTRHGYATLALRSLIDRSFRVRNFALLSAHVDSANHASRHTLERAGFRWVATTFLRELTYENYEIEQADVKVG